MKSHLIRVCLMSVLLLGCSTGDEKKQLEIEVGELLRDQFRRPATATPFVVTRALLNTVNVPQLEITIENDDVRDFLVPQLIRQDDQPGQLETWRTVDNLTFTFRDGLLTQTRGLGDVILSSHVPAQANGAAGPARSGARSYVLRGGDYHVARVDMACSLVNLGAQKLEIVEITYPVQHLREACEGGGGQIVNDYWIDAGNGRLWQSRQWAGPVVGYIRIRLLHFGQGTQENTSLMLGE